LIEARDMMSVGFGIQNVKEFVCCPCNGGQEKH